MEYMDMFILYIDKPDANLTSPKMKEKLIFIDVIRQNCHCKRLKSHFPWHSMFYWNNLYLNQLPLGTKKIITKIPTKWIEDLLVYWLPTSPLFLPPTPCSWPAGELARRCGEAPAVCAGARGHLEAPHGGARADRGAGQRTPARARLHQHDSRHHLPAQPVNAGGRDLQVDWPGESDVLVHDVGCCCCCFFTLCVVLYASHSGWMLHNTLWVQKDLKTFAAVL